MAQQATPRAGQLTSYRHDQDRGRDSSIAVIESAFRTKSRKLHLENGDAGTIVGIRNNPLSAAVKMLFDGENQPREITIRTLHKTHYDGLTRDYAMTVHAMQGRTVDHSYCSLMGAMTDQELTYVAFSRHRKSLEIFTDENHAGVALTNIARKATREGKNDQGQARPQGGLFASRSNKPPSPTRKRSQPTRRMSSELTINLKPEG